MSAPLEKTIGILDANPAVGAGLVTKKPDSPLRWFALFLNCVVMVGVYYAFDIPAALKTQVAHHRMCLSLAEFV